mmetsp:Transcript_75945/g.210873  ORF Transcript_75945/g.210873 Transcript_75945/m.210873 type:complete len:274 (+) Transcript_75945:237-1058(+)
MHSNDRRRVRQQLHELGERRGSELAVVAVRPGSEPVTRALPREQPAWPPFHASSAPAQVLVGFHAGFRVAAPQRRIQEHALVPRKQRPLPPAILKRHVHVPQERRGAVVLAALQELGRLRDVPALARVKNRRRHAVQVEQLKGELALPARDVQNSAAQHQGFTAESVQKPPPEDARTPAVPHATDGGARMRGDATQLRIVPPGAIVAKPACAASHPEPARHAVGHRGQGGRLWRRVLTFSHLPASTERLLWRWRRGRSNARGIVRNCGRALSP